MRILTRYILKEILSYSLVGLLVFTFVVYIPRIGHLLELVVRRGLPVSSVLLLFLLPVPSILVLTIPMAVLVGTVLGLSRMAADGEVIAARAVGIGRGQFALPVLAYALCGWALASGMSLFLAPRGALQLSRMESALISSQAPYEIKPRIFIEQFPNLLMYIQDISGGQARWRHVFIADTQGPGPPKVTLAESGELVNDPRSHGLVLHLDHGATHEIDPRHPDRYSIASFVTTDVPLTLSTPEPDSAEPRSPFMQSLPRLLLTIQAPPTPSTPPSVAASRRAAVVELNYRLALPVASLVLALVGMPLGLFSRKGGKAVGVMLTIVLVFVYYMLMAFGLSFAKQGRIPPVLGLWLANVIFGAAGALILARMGSAKTRLHFLQDWVEGLGRRLGRARRRPRPVGGNRAGRGRTLAHPRSPGSRVFQILDLYVLRGWVFYFLVLLVAFAGVYMIFDFFQLLGDIVRNHAGPGMVLNYYRYLSPQVIYLMLPLSVLVATLVNFSLLVKSNQVTAIKAAGISLYRISLPVLALAALLSAGMFVLGDDYLPQTNQRQSALRNEIKGKPPQTFFRPDLQWIFGESSRLYNYRFFDPERDVFASLSVFEFDPQTFSLTRRIYADRAFWEPHLGRWVLENGWERSLEGDKVTRYQPFAVETFKELTEPPSYFKKEVITSDQMSALELRRYINELSLSGFDVVQLSVELYRKFSYPLIALVVGLIAIPFSFTAGRKGALSGAALSIGIAIVYWSAQSLFETLGNLNQLPPAVAAWAPDVLFGLGGIYLLLRVRT